MSATLPSWYRAWDTPGGWWQHPRYVEALEVLDRHTQEKQAVAECILHYCATMFGEQRGHLMDFGSGLAAAPLALLKQGWTITLTDVDAAKVKHLEEQLAPPHRALHVDLLNPGDAFAGVPPATLVTLTHFLYHIPRAQWSQCFDLALSLCQPDGHLLMVMRSPTEYVNRWCASLGAPLIDVEQDAKAWADRVGLQVRALPLPLSMADLNRVQARLLIELMLRAVLAPDRVARIPDDEEITARIEADLFQGDRCIWPYGNAVVVAQR